MARRQAPRFDGNICSDRHQRRELQPGSSSALLRAHDLQCDALFAVQLGLWVTERTAANQPGLRAETRNSFRTDAINASWLSRRSARDLASALRVRRRGPPPAFVDMRPARARRTAGQSGRRLQKKAPAPAWAGAKGGSSPDCEGWASLMFYRSSTRVLSSHRASNAGTHAAHMRGSPRPSCDRSMTARDAA
jgi:hypothetical protein